MKLYRAEVCLYTVDICVCEFLFRLFVYHAKITELILMKLFVLNSLWFELKIGVYFISLR